MNRRATASGLLLILAFLLIVYILLLAPCEICDLIGVGCSACVNYGGSVILSESFGTLFPEAENSSIHEFENISYPGRITENFQIKTGVAGSKVTLSSNGEVVKTMVSENDGNCWFVFDSTFTISNFKLLEFDIKFKGILC